MDKKILLAHGSGGKLSHQLIQELFLSPFDNPLLNRLDDGAVFDCVAFTTDSYVVKPLFFPGGDIGKLAVYGTVNDLAMCGAMPLYLSMSFIIEEGFPLDDLKRVVASIGYAIQETGVEVVTGDTKVVNRGEADRLFINSTGLGIVPPGVAISGSKAQIGDKIILSGTVGDHGIAVMSQREGLQFSVPVESDCAPLNELVNSILKVSHQIHCLRDPTRGGLGTTLNELASQSNVGIRVREAAIPVRESVRAACELLGLDPIYVANEGKLVAIVAATDADRILAQMKVNSRGADSAIIGEVVKEHPGRVVMETIMGTSRIVNMLTGEQLPRIC